MTQQTCGNTQIAGCRFTVNPMTNDFVNIILGALNEVDISKVWMETDDVSTCIRGKISHIFDVSKAIFIHAAKTGEHVAFNATYSIGCPGDSEGDVYLIEDDVRMNGENIKSINQATACQFALYPMGDGNYMDVIYEQVQAIAKLGVEVSGVHYATRLDGDAKDIFQGLEQVFTKTKESGCSHTIMTVNLSANSPSSQGGSVNE